MFYRKFDLSKLLRERGFNNRVIRSWDVKFGKSSFCKLLVSVLNCDNYGYYVEYHLNLLNFQIIRFGLDRLFSCCPSMKSKSAASISIAF